MQAGSQTKTSIDPLDTGVLPELLHFERENRDYFAEWIPDRGATTSRTSEPRNQALLDEQSARVSFFFVVRDETDQLLGRVNLVNVTRGSASLGYRTARKATGVGHARRAVRLASVFARDHGLDVITAMTTHANYGSRRVLERSGFAKIAGNPTSVLQDGVEQSMVHHALVLGCLS